MEKDELKDVAYFVEADEYASHSLWAEHQRRASAEDPVWDSTGRGILRTVKSKKYNDSVSVHFSFFTLGGKKVAFFYPTSKFIDWDAVEQYVLSYVDSDRMTNAENFHNCRAFCSRKTLDPFKITAKAFKALFEEGSGDCSNGETVKDVIIRKSEDSVKIEFTVDCNRYGRHDGNIVIHRDRVVMNLPELLEGGDLHYRVKEDIKTLCK